MRSALLTLYRSLTRHRLYAILNIGGLALGIAVFLVLFLFVRFETGFDRVLPGSERVWVVQRTLDFPGVPSVPIPSRGDMLARWRADHPGDVGTRMVSEDVAVRNGAVAATERLARVDANYFALFPFPVVAGDPAAAVAAPGDAVITERIARTYFGEASPIGRTLVVVVGGQPRLYRVAALIADMPDAVTFKHDIFTALPRDGEVGLGSARGLTTFLRFDDAKAAEARGAQLPAFVARHPDPDFPPGSPAKVTDELKPLAALHLAAPRDRAIVAALGAVGLLALLTAIVNYVNLATARAGLRAREVALRKVVGATRRSLIVQFLAEALAATAAATLIGLALAELALPLVNAAGETALALRYRGAASILPAAGALILVVGLLAGFHPAVVLSRFRPAAVLASVRAPGGERAGARLRRALVVFQFAVAIALMIGTAVLVAQTRHMRSSDLGFRRAGLIMAPSFADPTLDAAQRRDLARAFAAIPGVTGMSEAAVAPGGGSFGIAPMHRAGATGPDPMIIQGEVGPRFFETYGARLLAGRFLDAATHALDEAPGEDKRSFNIVVNRTAAVTLGFADPAAAVDEPVLVDGVPATIVGVVADMRFRSPRDPVDAQAYALRSRGLGNPVLALRHEGEARPVLDRMAAAWRRIAPSVPYLALPVDRKLYETFHQDDARRSRLFTIGAVLAVAIGCVGLYGLAAFDTGRRVREIGIRKTLGASSSDVLRLLVGEFMRPVLVANIIAWPLAWLAMRRWLAGFDDRVALSPWFFVGALLVAAGIAVVTIVGQAWRAARAEPAAALR